MSDMISTVFCLDDWILSLFLLIRSQTDSNLLLSLETHSSMVLAPSPGESWQSLGPVEVMLSRRGLFSLISCSSCWISCSWSSWSQWYKSLFFFTDSPDKQPSVCLWQDVSTINNHKYWTRLKQLASVKQCSYLSRATITNKFFISLHPDSPDN
jgi:hypothetical protein